MTALAAFGRGGLGRRKPVSESERPWSIAGSAGEPILGIEHAPGGAASADGPRAVVIMAHGFKGYMDYGFLPRLARRLAAAGSVVHRFNFSHAGMTRAIDTFERPELFEADTWDRQVEDLAAIDRAIAAGELAGAGRPTIRFGHSRGGTAIVLAEGRGAIDGTAGMITAASPADAVRLDDETRARLRTDGFLESPSSRTGQVLRVGRAWLDAIEADPVAHDPLVMAGRCRVPWLLVHGGDDPTVPAADADRLAAAAGGAAETVVIPGANHVFDTPNPLPDSAAASPALERLIDACTTFIDDCTGAAT